MSYHLPISKSLNIKYSLYISNPLDISNKGLFCTELTYIVLYGIVFISSFIDTIHNVNHVSSTYSTDITCLQASTLHRYFNKAQITINIFIGIGIGVPLVPWSPR